MHTTALKQGGGGGHGSMAPQGLGCRMQQQHAVRGPEKPKTLVASNWILLLAIAGNCCWQQDPIAGNCGNCVQQANVLASCAAGVVANRYQSLPHSNHRNCS